MKINILLCFLVFSFNVSASCSTVTIEMMDKEAVAWAKVTAIDVVKEAFCVDKNQCPIDVTFKVLVSYRGKLKKTLHFNYLWELQLPEMVMFEKNKTYILAIKEVKEGTITLVGLTCYAWGLPAEREKELKDYLSTHSSPRIPEVKKPSIRKIEGGH